MTAAFWVVVGALGRTRRSEFIPRPPGSRTRGCAGECSPDLDFAREQLPNHFTWADHNQKSMLTPVLNQHIPQYCGSCWAFASLSALGDRIKIARNGRGADINLAIQHVLNCGDYAGSCYGGDHLTAYKWIHDNGHIAFDTAQQTAIVGRIQSAIFIAAPMTSNTCRARV